MVGCKSEESAAFPTFLVSLIFDIISDMALLREKPQLFGLVPAIVYLGNLGHMQKDLLIFEQNLGYDK